MAIRMKNFGTAAPEMTEFFKNLADKYTAEDTPLSDEDKLKVAQKLYNMYKQMALPVMNESGKAPWEGTESFFEECKYPFKHGKCYYNNIAKELSSTPEDYKSYIDSLNMSNIDDANLLDIVAKAKAVDDFYDTYPDADIDDLDDDFWETLPDNIDVENNDVNNDGDTDVVAIDSNSDGKVDTAAATGDNIDEVNKAIKTATEKVDDSAEKTDTSKDIDSTGKDKDETDASGNKKEVLSDSTMKNILQTLSERRW